MILKSKKFSYLFSTFLFLLFISCSPKLPVYKVSHASDTMGLNKIYDSDAEISYAVSKDAYNMYITLETAAMPNQIKMLNHGVTLFFDADGKKAQENFVQFPVKKEPSTPPDFKMILEDKQAYISGIINELSNDIVINKNGNATTINREFNTAGISVAIVYKAETLHYQITLPHSLLAFNNTTPPSLGIFIAGMSGGNSMQGNPNGGGRPPGIGGGRPAGVGGMSGGFGGGRPPAGIGRGGRSPNAQSPIDGMSKAINIWFQLELHANTITTKTL